MAEGKDSGGGGGIGGIIAEMIGLFWGLIVEMWEAFIKTFPTVLKMGVWVILGILILPCVFVAGVIYPMWVEWGEKM